MKRTLGIAAIAAIAFLCAGWVKEKIVYHISLQGATQLSCRITQRATENSPYMLVDCKYRCDRPVSATFDVRDNHENIMCRGPLSSPPAVGHTATESEVLKPPAHQIDKDDE